MFVSFNDGQQWQKFQQNLPLTPITDLKLFRDDMVLSTMGRGFWILDDISTLRQYSKESLSAHQLFQPKSTYRYRIPTGAYNSVSPDYPSPSVKINYYLFEQSKEAIQLDIKDKDGKVVYHIVSDTSKLKEKNKVIRDMATEDIRFVTNKNLSAKQGLHRFEWNFRSTGAWHKNKSRRYKNGPIVAPGTYTATLTVGDWSSSKPIELLMDPRLIEQGLSLDDLQQQADLQHKVMTLLEAARKLEQQLEKELKTTKDNNKLAAIKTALENLQTAEGIYMQPKLLDQISYLNSMINRADQLPGQDAYERFRTLEQEFDDLKASLK